MAPVTEDAGLGGTLSKAAEAKHEKLVAAWMAEAEAANPKRVAKVTAKHQVLTENQLRYRQARESNLSNLLGQSMALAIDGRGKRIYPASDV